MVKQRIKLQSRKSEKSSKPGMKNQSRDDGFPVLEGEGKPGTSFLSFDRREQKYRGGGKKTGRQKSKKS